MSEQNAIKALVAAQSSMDAVRKNANNPHFKSKYADLGAVIDATFPALHANGFAVFQPAGSDDFGPYVDTILAHESGHQFTSRVHLKIGKQDMQGVGSAHTYARRYGLMAMCGVAPEDDDGNATQKPKFDSAAFTGRLLKSIETARDMDALKGYWGEVNDAKGKLADRQFADLLDAKNARKAQLEGAPDGNGTDY